MKKFASKIEKLGQKSAQFQHALESVPDKIAQFRETVAMTTGQLQQLRADVQASVAELRIDSEERLLEALREIQGSKEALEQAGFALASVEMELSPAHRLIVHLDRIEEVPSAGIRTIAASHQQRKTAHALLASLARAQETSSKVDLGELVYSRVVVHVGPIPSIRLCWNPEKAVDELTPTVVPSSVTPPPPIAPSAFSQSSYFERPYSQSLPAKLTATSAAAPEITAMAPSPHPTSPPPIAAELKKSDWRKGALDRFKTMPDVSKYTK